MTTASTTRDTPLSTSRETHRVYFAVPTHYTIGAEFDTYEAAVEHARSTIREFDFGGFSRAFVDVRVNDKNGDREIMRVEVFA